MVNQHRSPIGQHDRAVGEVQRIHRRPLAVHVERIGVRHRRRTPESTPGGQRTRAAHHVASGSVWAPGVRTCRSTPRRASAQWMRRRSRSSTTYAIVNHRPCWAVAAVPLRTRAAAVLPNETVGCSRPAVSAFAGPSRTDNVFQHRSLHAVRGSLEQHLGDAVDTDLADARPVAPCSRPWRTDGIDTHWPRQATDTSGREARPPLLHSLHGTASPSVGTTAGRAGPRTPVAHRLGFRGVCAARTLRFCAQPDDDRG